MPVSPASSGGDSDWSNLGDDDWYAYICLLVSYCAHLYAYRRTPNAAYDLFQHLASVTRPVAPHASIHTFHSAISSIHTFHSTIPTPNCYFSTHLSFFCLRLQLGYSCWKWNATRGVQDCPLDLLPDIAIQKFDAATETIPTEATGVASHPLF